MARVAKQNACALMFCVHRSGRKQAMTHIYDGVQPWHEHCKKTEAGGEAPRGVRAILLPQSDDHPYVLRNVQAWQESRNKTKAAEEAAKEAEEAQAAKWSLEDDFEEDEGGTGPSRASRKAPQEGSDEIDPLEAFMNQNADSLNPPSRPKASNLDEMQDEKSGAVDDDDEVDPLDAYMDAQVTPPPPPPPPPPPHANFAPALLLMSPLALCCCTRTALHLPSPDSDRECGQLRPSSRW